MKWRTFSRVSAGLLVVASLTGCNSKTVNSQMTEPAAEKNVQESMLREEEQPTVLADEDGSNILIAYFAVAENSDVDAISSASMVTINGEAEGRVQHLAKLIQKETDGEMFSIQTSVDYPGDGSKLIDYAAQEQDDDARPEITNHIENFDSYDVVFVGYPTWWYDLPQVMYSFFDEYDFSGKTIIPFNSHNGSRFSNTISTITELEPNAKVITEGFTVNEKDVAAAGEDIALWLQELGF